MLLFGIGGMKKKHYVKVLCRYGFGKYVLYAVLKQTNSNGLRYGTLCFSVRQSKQTVWAALNNLGTKIF